MADATACRGCPWRTENHGRDPLTSEQLARYKHIESEDFVEDWFGDENRRRLWDGLRDGEAMTCHSTDPNQWDGLERDRPDLCAGMLILVQRELNTIHEILEAGGDLRDYHDAHPDGLTERGVRAWTINLTLPTVMGGLADITPKTVAPVDVAVISPQEK